MPCANLSLISEIIKFLQVGNFGGILGNSGYEDGVGKKIGAEGLAKYETDAENGNPKFSRFSKNQTKHVTRKQTKPTSLSQEIYQLDRKIPERVGEHCCWVEDTDGVSSTRGVGYCGLGQGDARVHVM